MPTVQEQIFEYEQNPTAENLAAVLTNKDCVLQMPDGETMDARVMAGGPEQMLGYLQDRFLKQTDEEKSFFILRDKAHPENRPQAVSFTGSGIEKITPINNAEEFAKDYLPKALQEPKEPKKPSFGAKLKEFFSFFTGGSKTVREYNRYEEEKRACASRRYDYLKKMGFAVQKPENYVRTPKTEVNRTKDFTQYLVEHTTEATRREVERVNSRNALNAQLRENINMHQELSDSAFVTAVRENLDSALVKDQFSNKTLGLLTQLTPDDVTTLDGMIRVLKIDTAQIPDILAAAGEKVEEAPTKEEFLKAVHERFLKYPYEKDNYAEASRARNAAKTDARNRIQQKQYDKLYERLQKGYEGTKMYTALSDLVKCYDANETMKPSTLTLLAECKDETFTRLSGMFERSKLKSEELVGFMNKYTEPKGMVIQQGTMVNAMENALRNYQPQNPTRKMDDLSKK